MGGSPEPVLKGRVHKKSNMFYVVLSSKYKFCRKKCDYLGSLNVFGKGDSDIELTFFPQLNHYDFF